MKLLNRYILLLAAFSLSGCNDWLDITPEDTTTEKQLFTNFGGYHSAINGLYQTLSLPELYGENLSWGFTSALSQYYDNKDDGNNKSFSYTEQYEYNTDEVREITEEIWTTGYNIIANCNNIIQHLSTAPPSMFPNYEKGEMDLIKGEALAIRGMMHFDLLRLFADAPVVSKTERAIPYSTLYPDKFPTRYTVEEVIEKVVADLEEASTLLVRSDSIGGYNDYMYNSNVRFMTSNQGLGFFFSARGARLNYVAVRSLLARVYAYAGDLEKAYDYAKQICDVFVDEHQWYGYTKFSTGDSESTRPHKLIDELLVAFFSETLVTDFSLLALRDLDYNSYALKNLDQIFKDADDYRRTKLIMSINLETKVSLKYTERTGGKVENNLLPAMRLSELHLLMAEYLAQNNRIGEAVKIVNDLRIARGCQTRTIPDTIGQQDLLEEIGQEVWRENIAEGQYFFYCKRLNTPTINNNGVHVPMAGKYTLPIPDSETTLN